MNEEELRRIVREEVEKVLDELVFSPLFELVNGQEAGISAFKQRYKELKLVGEWNPSRIKWVETEGFKGKYERYPAEGVKVEGNRDYWNMLKDLKAHGGKLTRNSYFYWIFKDGSTVGRKKR